ncbi:MAG: helicase-related protein, partial [Gaiellaceae bacterium]
MRRYRELGFLKENIPERDPRPVWITMREDERLLYDRIEEYISDFYQRYEAERRGLGFVMTVYRRRLTSSFAAIERSLRRRLDFLEGKAAPAFGLTDEDKEEEELDLDLDEELEVVDRALFEAEIEYIYDFLDDLQALSGDSKWDRFRGELQELLARRDSAVVFTQYTDTMDDLRTKLAAVYGSEVACYSGRGGEVFDGGEWRLTSKEEVKNAFRERQIKILLCTEAASEGLNLQTCGVLINYDMPWNPMRVEQRIGRIDRLGQKHQVMRVVNLHYKGTVETDVYIALR